MKITDIAKQYYLNSEKWFKLLLCVKGLAIIINLISVIIALFLNDPLKSTWISVTIILTVSLIEYFLLKTVRKNYSIGEKLRKIQFDYVNLNIEISPFERSYILPDANLDYDKGYFENLNLKYSLLQNIYLTSKNYSRHYSFFSNIVTGFICIISLILIIFLALLTSDLGNLTLKLAAPQILFIPISIFLASNVIEIKNNFKTKKEDLKKLDEKLSLTSYNEENKIISFLVEFNLILTDSYPTFNFLYEKKREAYNKAWEERMKGYSKELLKDGINNYVVLNLKRLFTSKYKLQEIIIIGSYLDDSFIFGKSDLDVLLVFEIDAKTDSNEFYTEVFEQLENKYGNNLMRSLPSFIIRDFSDVILEITPCFKSEANNIIEFNIVKQGSGWNKIIPQIHKDYFKKTNDISNGIYLEVLKEIKEWKYEKNIQISSFFMQIILSELINKLNKFDYDEILNSYFTLFTSTHLTSIEDPLNIVGKIKPSYNQNYIDYTSKIEDKIKELKKS